MLRILTKEHSLKNLNWDKVLHQKSACLDIEKPRAQKMSHFASTTWNICSDASLERTLEAETRDCTEKASKKPVSENKGTK